MTLLTTFRNLALFNLVLCWLNGAPVMLATDVNVSDRESSQVSPPEGFSAIEARAGGRLGVAALDTSSGKRLEYRADERFAMCSTFKVLAAAAVLKRVDAHQQRLEDMVTYSERDLLDYAPVAKEHVKEGGMDVESLCAAAVELSDNTAGNLMLRLIGGPEYLTRYVRTLGDKLTRLDRVEPDLNTAIPGDERDTTTPAAIVGNLRALLLGDALSAASRSHLEGWMMACKTGGSTIRAGMPALWRVGDKTGRGDHGVVNDIAIVRPPGREPLLIAIYFAESSASAEARSAVVADAARIVADGFAAEQ